MDEPSYLLYQPGAYNQQRKVILQIIIDQFFTPDLPF
jgi:hypothetical protein